MTANGYSSLGGENILKLDSGGGCTNHTLKSEFSGMCITCQ